ncbi:SNF2-related protein [Novosphingobium sp. FKTRR1]|uniref:SNF2-related protein n=1 Tax=Novosphingobium sp. FKTRR1 TaxID=2879118 RepID=UPI001CF0936A|nr:SNF2-related protein [Novosphingobium sp. FKTRR1]
MPRNVTVTFNDGSQHVYANAPDDITPQQIVDRATQEFRKPVKALDGGRGPVERTLRGIGAGIKSAYNAADNAMQPLRDAVGIDPNAAEAERRAVSDRMMTARANDIGEQHGTIDRLGDFFKRGEATLDAGMHRLAGQNDEARRAEDVANAKIDGEVSWQEAKGNLLNMPQFLLEQGVSSLPSMAAAAATPFGTIAAGLSNTGQIAQARAEGDGRQDASTTDKLIAAPFGAVSALLDLKGFDSIIEAEGKNALIRILKAGGAEGLTEAAQGAIEYAGGSVGTKQGFSWTEALDQALQSGIVGAGVGGAIRTGEEGLHGGLHGAGKVFRLAGQGITSRPIAPGKMFDGIRNAAVTPEDEASPIPTDIIAKGKAEMAAATGKDSADAILKAAGMPTVGKRVSIEMPGGDVREGTVSDAFDTDAGDMGRAHGLSVQMDDGSTFAEHFDTLKDAGVKITEATGKPAPLAEADAIDAGLRQSADAPLDLGTADQSEPATPAHIAQRGNPVANAKAVVEEVYPGAKVTSWTRPVDGVGSPTSWHKRSKAAVDVAPIKGMSFDQFVAGFKAKGYSILESIDEVNHPSKWATGPHWHIVLGEGGAQAAAAPGQSSAQATAAPSEPRAPGSAMQDDMFGGPSMTESQVAARDDVAAVLDSANQEAEADGKPLDLGRAVQDYQRAIDNHAADGKTAPLTHYLETDAPQSLTNAVFKNPDLLPLLAQRAGIEQAASTVADPTDAQKEAGNYRKGHVRVHGIDITVETPKGRERSGTDPNGKPWAVTMPDHYGYVKRTEGADGEQVDVYVGPNPEAQTVYVVDQNHAGTGKFDEHKAMLGYNSQAEAEAAYHAGFSDGRGGERMANVTAMPVGAFKEWLKQPRTKPIAEEQATGTGADAPAGVPDVSKDDYARAVDEVRRAGVGSASLIQRKLGIKHQAQAAVLLARMVREGIVGPIDQKTGQHPVLQPQAPVQQTGSAPRVESLTEKSVIVRGLDKSDASRAKVASALPEKGSPLWNEKEKGWVVSKKHEAKLRAVIEGTESSTQKPQSSAPDSAKTKGESTTPKSKHGPAIVEMDNEMFSRVWKSAQFRSGTKGISLPHPESPAGHELAQGWYDGGAFAIEKLRSIVADLEANAKAQGMQPFSFNPVQSYIEGFYARVVGEAAEIRQVQSGDVLGAKEALKVIESHEDGDGPAAHSAATEDAPVTDDARAEFDRKYPADKDQGYAIASPAGVTRVGMPGNQADPKSVRRAIMEAAVRNGVSEQYFDQIMAWAGGEATFGPIHVLSGQAQEINDRAKKIARELQDQAINDAASTTPAQPTAPLSTPTAKKAATADAARRLSEAMSTAAETTPSNAVGVVAVDAIEKGKPAKAGRFTNNKIFTEDKVAAARARIKEKLNRLNAGIDPELLMDGVVLAGAHIESGIRKFADVARALADDLGTSLTAIKPYLRAWYNGARDMMEDAGEDVSDMDGPGAVKAALTMIEDMATTPVASAKEGTENVDAGTAVHPDGAGSLAGVPANDVSRPAGKRDAERDGAEAESAGSRAGRASDAVGGDAKARGRGNGSARPDPSTAGTRDGDRGRGGVEPSSAGEQSLTDPNEAIEKASPTNVPASNFTITDDVALGQGTEGVKFADNIAAIETLKKIEAENRRASPAEQRTLARYVGWGGLKNAFRVAGAKDGEGVAKGWEKRAAQLEELLTPSELKAARNSTTAAHYTSQTVVDAMWQATRRLGFAGGAMIEPSVGTGNFLGLMPEALRGDTKVFAVEYDSLTARMAQKLYPHATIVHSGLQDLPLPKNQFALAIGNPPFGRESLYFPHNAALNGKSIHNQFFLASLDTVAPNGLMAMVVSHNLMDSLDPSARYAMAEKAEFLGGIRLPDTAFKENARTEVVTDMLFFRKRTESEIEAATAAVAEMQTGKLADKMVQGQLETKADIARWVKSSKITDPAGSGEEINANDYFMSRPDMVVGKINATGTMNMRSDLNVTLDDPAQFKPMLDRAVSRLPQRSPATSLAARTTTHFDVMANAMRLSARRAEVGAVQIDLDGNLKMVVDIDGGDMGKALKREITLTENTPFASDYTLDVNGKWQKTVDLVGPDGKPKKIEDANGRVTNRNAKETITYQSESDIPAKDRWGKDRIAALRGMLPIKEAMKRQLVLETQGATDGMIDLNRKALNKVYDAFVKKHGNLNDAKNAKVAMLMPDGALALAAETNGGTARAPKVQKADILSRRVAMPPQIAERADNAAEAVGISLSEFGHIDLGRVAKLLGTDEAGAAKALAAGDEPSAFYDPEAGRWEARDLYLSGLVRRKLNMAREAGLESNVKALEAVMPKDWTMEQITPIIGSAWIPGDVYADFYRHLGFSKAHVSYSPVTNTFSVIVDGKPAVQWATSNGAHPTEAVVSRLLNTQSMKVQRKDADGKTYTDEEATAESEQKASEIHNEFLSWAFSEENRAQRLVGIFNEKFNTRLIRQRDGSHLKLFGKVPDTVIKMRRHQMNGIWRGITDRAVLYDHVVGAGKTFTAIARIMERRRMGMSQKPMIVVPNHLVEQWAKDVKALYPGANVIAAGKADFERKNRRRLFARIGSSDFDMVIIGHSSFGFIDLDPATEDRYLTEELASAVAAVGEAQKAADESGMQSWRKPMGVAEAERLVKKLEERLARLRTAKRDRLLTFEEMGIDDLTIDEAHEFKNLAYSSRLQNVSGMGNKVGSQKAVDLHLKVRSLAERQGTSTAFLTGTPVSNSVAEMYLLLRNLVPQEMKEMGIENFDAWRSMFVSYGTAWEPTESGGVKEVNRLGREWNNMRTLMDLYYSVADAVTMDDIKSAYAEDNPGKKFPIPEVASRNAGKGDREAIVVQPDEVTARMLTEVVNDFRALPGISDPKERNAERLRLMDRARKVSLDPRAVNPRNEAPPTGGKIRSVTDRVAQIYRKWDADKGTQIIFLDRSVPKAKGDEKVVEAYDALKVKLAEAVRSGDDKAEGKLLDDLEKYNPDEMESLRVAVQGGWNAYDEIKRQLIAHGIPENEIRFVQEANTDQQKLDLFDLVKKGDVRVLIGSTPRMGAGTNVQDRLVALHHVDVTWKPSDIEQREGRIVRQGNKLLEKYGDDFAVDVIAYTTARTVDAKMWDLNASKLKAINGIRKYDGWFSMEFEDEESASMAEMAALATGDPMMIERVTLDTAIKKLELQQRSFNNRQNALRAKLAQSKRTVSSAPGRIAMYEKFADEVEAAAGPVGERSGARSITVEGETYSTRDAADEAAQAAITRIRGDDPKARFSIEVGGEKVTTQDQIGDALRTAFGTPGFEGSSDGETFTHVMDLAKVMSARATIAAKAKGEFTLDGMSINGIAVELDVAESRYGKTKSVTLSALNEDGRAVISRESLSDGTSVSMMRALIDKVVDGLDPQSFRAAAKIEQRSADRAQDEIGPLETEVEKPWPQADDLSTKRDRLKDVITELAEKEKTKQSIPVEDAPESLRQRDLEDQELGREARAERERYAKTVADLEARLRQLGLSGKVALALVSTINRDGLPTKVAGEYWQGLIRIALQSRQAKMFTLNHEIIHHLRRVGGTGVFKPAEWTALTKRAEADTSLMASIRDRYPHLDTEGQFEEAVADMFAHWSDGRSQERGFVAKAFERLAEMFRAIGQALRGGGFTTPESVMRAVENGIIAGRESGQESAGEPKASIPDETPAFDNAETERRFQDAKAGLNAPTTLRQRVTEFADRTWSGMTRHWIALPNEPRYAALQQKLRAIEAAPDFARERTVQMLDDMVAGFSNEDLDLFTRKVILDDLAWDAANERDLPFGFTRESLMAEKAKIDRLVEAQPDKRVWKAAMKRKLVNRKIAQELVDVGVLEAEQIKNPAYYRHQVLEYARAQAQYARTPGKKLKTPKWAQRMGSTLDINANLLEAEFDWLNKALVDIPVAKTIEWIKQSEHNILGRLQSEAKASNKAGVAAVIASAQETIASKLSSKQDIAQAETLIEQEKGFRQKIAMGFDLVKTALEDGEIEVPRQFTRAAAAIESGKGMGTEPPFAFLSWMLDTDQPGAMGAAMVMKAIGQRRAWTKAVLGKGYVNPDNAEELTKRLAPEGYRTWQPDEGRLLFTVKTIPEHVIDGMMEKLEAPEGIDPAMLRAVLESSRNALAVGGQRYTMILPQEVADTLSNLRRENIEGLFDHLMKEPLKLWKRWVLINPRRFFKYNLNNATGDLDAVLAGNPRSLRRIGDAAKELSAVMRGKAKPSARYEEARARGVFDSGLSIQEIPDLHQLAPFEKFQADQARGPISKVAILPLKKVWGALQGATQWRENVLRYASYLDYADRLESGESQASVGYGASVPRMVDAVPDLQDRAALLARDLLGDYAAISHYGGWLRQTAIPFWSWTEINTKRYWRLTSNAYSQGIGQGFATGGALGAAAGARATAWMFVRMAAIYGMMALWNGLFFGDEEDELSDEQKAQMHVILGRDSDGNIISMRAQGALSDALGWFGFGDIGKAAQAYELGRGSLMDVLTAAPKAAINKVATSLTPMITVPVEAATGKKLWPDVFNTRQNRDPWRNLMSTFSMENEYDLAMGKPSRGYGRSWQEAAIYRRDPGEVAYNTARSVAYDWLKREKGQEFAGGFTTKRGDAMRDFRTALKFGDKDAARQALTEMVKLGVDRGDYAAMMKRAAPLGPIPVKDRPAFVAQLTDDERAAFIRAQGWYESTFLGR